MSVISVSVPGFRVAEYGNYPFDSGFTLNGEHLGLGADGLYLLDSDTDTGVPIAASLLTGATTFDSPNSKRIKDALAGVKAASGAVTFCAQANERVLRTSVSTKPDDMGYLRQVRFHAGRNFGRVSARAWQFGFQNENGVDFTLYDMTIHEQTLLRPEK